MRMTINRGLCDYALEACAALSRRLDKSGPWTDQPTRREFITVQRVSSSYLDESEKQRKMEHPISMTVE